MAWNSNINRQTNKSSVYNFYTPPEATYIGAFIFSTCIGLFSSIYRLYTRLGQICPSGHKVAPIVRWGKLSNLVSNQRMYSIPTWQYHLFNHYLVCQNPQVSTIALVDGLSPLPTYRYSMAYRRQMPIPAHPRDIPEDPQYTPGHP